MKLRVFAISMILLCGLGAVWAATQDEVMQAEKNWAAVTMKGDLVALDKILHADLIYTHSSSTVENKSVFFGRLKSGAVKYESIEHESMTVKPYGDAAIAHSKVRMRGVSDGQPFNVHAVMTHVWVKQGGAWKLALHQATKLPE